MICILVVHPISGWTFLYRYNMRHFLNISRSILFFLIFLSLGCFSVRAQNDQQMYEIIQKVDQNRLASDIETLANFGTRHTLSDTVSKSRGIGAARRWIKTEFENISAQCGGCLEVFYQRSIVKKGTNERIFQDVWVVNVVAIQKGTTHPENYVIMSGDIDSRISDPNNAVDEAPGANDNASGMAGTLESARVLSHYTFKNSIVYVGLSGEEQGLFGGKGLATYALDQNWNIIGVLNNDMIGNTQGIDGVKDNRSFRIFSEPTPVTETEQQRKARRFYGGEVDGVSRQLARYVYKTTKQFMPEMNPMMIYRLDRFGRGGHHRPFNDAGFTGIRIMEAHENYDQQHQDLRIENGVNYGDRLEHVDMAYVKKLTAVNAINLAQLAEAPLAPTTVAISGMVAPSTRLSWSSVDGATAYRVYWRDTTSPHWQYSRLVSDVTDLTLEGIVIDNFLFGVASVGPEGHESPVKFPNKVIR